MSLPALPKALPVGTTDPTSLADMVRELREYLRRTPTVERLNFRGVVSFPLTFQVATRPFFVALTGRPNPDNTTPVVEVLGLTFTWEAQAGGALIKVESIDGVAAGDDVTLTGIAVGERA